MRSDFITNFRRSPDLEAEAMINEGGAIRQPSMRDAEAEFARLKAPCSCGRSRWGSILHSRASMFWAGFATGLAVGLLEKRLDERA